MMKVPFLFVLLAMLCVALRAQQPSQTNQHAAGVDSRGDHAMGFSHDKTAHHFYLLADGGSIQVLANDPSDSTSREEIQMHLMHIVSKFRDNDFDIPMFIHDTVPPGVPVMKEKRAVITYLYEPTETGGLVRIKTDDSNALKAIHAFLVFQIQEHRTGDPERVASPIP